MRSQVFESLACWLKLSNGANLPPGLPESPLVQAALQGLKVDGTFYAATDAVSLCWMLSDTCCLGFLVPASHYVCGLLCTSASTVRTLYMSGRLWVLCAGSAADWPACCLTVVGCIMLVSHHVCTTCKLTCTPQVVELIWITVDTTTCIPVPGMTGLAQHLVGQIMALRPRFSVALRKAIAGERLP